MKTIQTSAEFITLKSGGGNTRLVTPDLLAHMNGDAVALWRKLDYFELRDSATVYTLPQVTGLQAAVDEQKAIEKAKRTAKEDAAKAKIEAAYGTSRMYYCHPDDRHGPYHSVLLKVDSLKSQLVATFDELRALKASPAQLRRSLKAAELKQAKAKDLAAFVKLCQKTAKKLPAKPAAPIKGLGYVREHFPIFRTAKGRALWDSIPNAHAGKIKTSSGGARCIASPEAAKAFSALLQTLSPAY